MSKDKKLTIVPTITLKIERGGSRLVAGKEASVKEAEAHRLVKAGRANWPAGNAAPKPAKPEGEALTAAISEAIGKMDRSDQEQMTAAGVPSTSALAQMLGYSVSAEERDAGWARFQEQNPGLFKD
ncbi:hypothetical protein [Fodinicurvata fenggangensis]|uniref:hypothetical protein n=1 Tax=Fodinicurvata fenggangensis TaxID=1121830 RepID=UPI0004790497|nr:hypothetical protein [Fodinicurvata fenggangensis]